MPGRLKGLVDYYFDSDIGTEFGGPLNGQIHRRAIFTDVTAAIGFNAVVETGTFRGVTTRYFAKQTNLPVFSVELEQRYFEYSKLSLRDCQKVNLSLGDSRAFLNKLINDPTCPKENVFFYLDAHWNADLPLYDEIELIGDHWAKSVVMIDDFEVPDDPGYAFDDYGGGAKLSLEYIQPLLKDNWSVFFPSAKSEEETGFKRGAVVLAAKEVEDRFAEIKSLRRYDSPR